MPYLNKKDLIKLIDRISKDIDNKYTSLLSGAEYVEIQDLSSSFHIRELFESFTGEEISTLIKHLAEDELGVISLIEEKIILSKFFNAIKKSTIKNIPLEIVKLDIDINVARKNILKEDQEKKKNKQLFMAARLTPRQKKILQTIGLPINNYEKSI